MAAARGGETLASHPSSEINMIGNLALREDAALDAHASLPSRDETLARYHHLREISKRHHANIQAFLSGDAIFRHGRRLGLAQGKTFILDSMDEMVLVMDLAIHTAPADRSRAIDRYANSAPYASGTDEALMLEAMRQARFAILLARRRHPAVGLIVTDLFREIDLWLIDEGLERSLPIGAAFATRYYSPSNEPFVMTAGVAVPVETRALLDVVASVPQLTRKSRIEAMDDRRFAEAIYRGAVENGTAAKTAYVDPSEAATV